ncbi:thiamine pyrophosphate-binding protein [Streptomyces catenulae]|uniref:Thiamine pyrophosphate-binding protein n=1 Tax=Streptomyces catenulae TaxID=66875 RepID=A0ABV2YYS7_9ACTN|nr:thiamine pyrophosphate-binding protein [Streptomyces catenulae]
MGGPPRRVPALRGVVRALRRAGCDTVFGCPGASLAPLYAALDGPGIAHLAVRHAESAPHMAIGWSRVRGRAALAAVPADTGAARVLPALGVALADAVPLVCVVGTGAPGGAPDLVRLARPLVKWAVRVEQPARLAWAFREALWTAREGSAGPVLIELPLAVASATVPADGPGDRHPAPPGPPRPPAPPAQPPPPAHPEIAGWLAEGAETYLVGSDAAAYAAVGGGRLRAVATAAGPPGWEIPTALGVRTALDAAEPTGADGRDVVALLDDPHGFPALAGELALAAHRGAPLVLLMPPGRAGLPPGHGPGGCAQDASFTDPVQLVAAYGCTGRTADGPGELRSALAWARKEAVSTRRPVLVRARYATAPASGGPPHTARE